MRAVTAKNTPTEIEFTAEELDQLVDQESLAALGIKGSEFKRRLMAGELPNDNPRVREIIALIKLAA